MPQQAWSKKRERQYEKVKGSLKDQGRSEGTAEEIASRTVNKERARSGEARQKSKSSTDDISSGRRGGKRSGEWAGRPDQAAALQRGQAEEHQGPLEHEQGRAGEGRRSLAPLGIVHPWPSVSAKIRRRSIRSG